jgi:AraC-like DNA-binding protein
VEETIGFRRSPDLPGVEILDADHTAREWRWFNTAYGVAVSRTWHCDVVYRRRRREMLPGMAFCSEAGEVHTTPGVRSVGSFSALIVEPMVLSDYIAEHTGSSDLPHWAAMVAKPSPELARRLSTLVRAVGRDRTALQLQSAFVDLVESLLNEFVEKVPGAPRPVSLSMRAAERIRECLHEDHGGKSDLATLAQETGLSRFQVLREFKRRYGLPPYAYQLCVRIAHARGLLQRDVSPAEVAAACGFADQSHFTRHFRRMVGTTPLRYARAGGRPTTDQEVRERLMVDFRNNVL